MEIIDVLREARKLIVDTIDPDYVRIDPLPSGTYISCGGYASDIVMSAKLHSPIQGLDQPIAISSPKILSRLLDSPDYRGGDTKVSFVDSGPRHLHFSNSLRSTAQVTVLGGGTLNTHVQMVKGQQLVAQLIMPVNALWKQQFEYWSKAEEEAVGKGKGTASFVSQESGLSCLVGDYNFDHHIWSCESGAEAGFVSAISFRCLPMIKVLQLFPHVRRMSISVSTNQYVKVQADGYKADYSFFLRGEVPHWYQAARLPIYDFDDPRSVIQQRSEEI